ncbi:MAG: transcription termination/antitermination protein NusG [Desulfotomaculales bacterium]
MWYALQVFTGQELEIAYRVEQRARCLAQGITRVVAGLKHVARLGADGRVARRTYERVIPSYIFIEVPGPLTADIYQLVRSVPGVCRIFAEPIADQEMQPVFSAIEAQVEVSHEDAEKVARQFRREFSRKLFHVWERLRPLRLQAAAFFRGLRTFLRVPSRVLRAAISSIPPASVPDLLTLFCLLTT